jgi:hypothetical protein
MDVLFALFLLAHAGIHTLWFGPRPTPSVGAPAWPFALETSALVHAGIHEATARIVGLVLLAGTLVGFGLAALSALAVLPAATFEVGIALGATASTVMLVAFFHPWLVLGIGIDVVLLWAALILRWTPESLA